MSTRFKEWVDKTAIPLLVLGVCISILLAFTVDFNISNSNSYGIKVFAAIFYLLLVILLPLGVACFVIYMIKTYVLRTKSARRRLLLSIHLRAFVNMQMPLDTTLSSVDGGGYMNRLFRAIAQQLSYGEPLHQALRRTGALPDWYVKMVEIGESRGTLKETLDRLIEIDRQEENGRAMLINTLTYPVAVTLVMCGVVTLIVMLIIPKFKKMYDGMGVELPGMTLALMAFADFVSNYWVWWLPFAFAGLCLAMLAFPNFFVSIFPRIYRSHLHAATARWLSGVGLALSTGGTLAEATLAAVGISRARIFKKAAGAWHLAVDRGGRLAQVMKASSFVPRETVWQVATCERSEKLPEVLREESNRIMDRLERSHMEMVKSLGIIYIMFLGLVVGFVVLCLFMPLVKIIVHMGGY